MDFRPDFPVRRAEPSPRRCRNAMVLLDLENCDAGYSPTHGSATPPGGVPPTRSEVIFDGIDTDLWRPTRGRPPRSSADARLPAGTRIVTYVIARHRVDARASTSSCRSPSGICDAATTSSSWSSARTGSCYGGDAEAHRRQELQGVRARRRTTTTCRGSSSPALLPPQRAGPAVRPERPAHLPDGAVRAVVVAVERPGLRLHGAGLRHRAGPRGDRTRRDRPARRLLRRRGPGRAGLCVLRDPPGYRDLGLAAEASWPSITPWR